MNKHKPNLAFKLFMLIAFTLFTFKINAQNVNFKTWIGVAYEQKIKIKKFKFDVSAAQQFRFSNLATVPKYSALTEVGVSKGFKGFYKIGIDYRASYLDGFTSRISLSNNFKVKIKDATLSFRLKYQAEFEMNKPFSQDIRLRTKLSYKANKDFRPYAFGEILYNKNYKFSNFNEFRVGLGLDADYKKKNIFDVMLMYVQDLNRDRCKRNMVLALEYKFSR